MDMGIIANVKHWYRSIFSFKHLIPALDNKKPLDFDVYKALTIIVAAWERVSSRTIARCFRKAGFGQSDDEDDDEDDLPLAELAARMSAARGEVFTEDDAHLFLMQEESLPTSGEMDDDDIVSKVKGDSAEVDERDEGPAIITEERPSMEEYMKATEICQRFWMLAEPSDLARRYLIMATELQTVGITGIKHRQTRISDFFKAS